MFKIVSIIAYIFVLIGALNWGLVGFFNLDLVEFLFDEMSPVSRAIYCLVGISAVFSIFTAYTHCRGNE